MITRSTNIYYNQHHDISHLLHLHDEVLMVSYDGDMMIMIITMIHNRDSDDDVVVIILQIDS